ncbi:unnamed protein product [Cuscuta europaea]|uniref:C2 domain-containing protein n=1 Tax=Cuscuta europaea TaxID=41803 RepID=A0A9P1E7I8_CUSEU|nr:unnamed protein product [Cuscuta europaea]
MDTKYAASGKLAAGKDAAVLVKFLDGIADREFVVKLASAKDKKVVGSKTLDYRWSEIICLQRGVTVAPAQYSIADKGAKDELRISVWLSTNKWDGAVEATSPGSTAAASHPSLRSYSYAQPKLAYCRVVLLQLEPSSKSCKAPLKDGASYYVHCQMGGEQHWWTPPLPHPSPYNNIENTPLNCHAFGRRQFWFAADQVDPDSLTFTVMVRPPRAVGATKEPSYDVLGSVVVPMDGNGPKLKNGQKHHDGRFMLVKSGDELGLVLHAAVWIDRNYHVFDDLDSYTSDRSPTVKRLNASALGIAELDVTIERVEALVPIKKQKDVWTTDPYCVAKYGNKFCKTHTAAAKFGASADPKFNHTYKWEAIGYKPKPFPTNANAYNDPSISVLTHTDFGENFTWEVYDPNTVLTIGVFDNSNVVAVEGKKDEEGKKKKVEDMNIGKVKVPISTLLIYKSYKRVFPLFVVHPELGPQARIMGMLHVTIQLVPRSLGGFLFTYFTPPLPSIHYLQGVPPLEKMPEIRRSAVALEVKNLARSDPPLGGNVVRYMTTPEQGFSRRVLLTNIARLCSASGLRAPLLLVGLVLSRSSLTTSWLVSVLLTILLLWPFLIIPLILSTFIVVGLVNLATWASWSSSKPSFTHPLHLLDLVAHQVTSFT